MAYAALLSYRRREFARAEELLDEARRTLGEKPSGQEGPTDLAVWSRS